MGQQLKLVTEAKIVFGSKNGILLALEAIPVVRCTVQKKVSLTRRGVIILDAAESVKVVLSHSPFCHQPLGGSLGFFAYGSAHSGWSLRKRVDRYRVGWLDQVCIRKASKP